MTVIGLGGDQAAMGRHFVAVSTNLDGVTEFGIDTTNMFRFWDWVGGRYSFDSAVGLSLMVAIGPERFTEMLAGFHARLTGYLQQLEMESNGKRVDLAGGIRLADRSGRVGPAGTNGQRAFYQALHQGTEPAPAEMIGFWQPVEDLGNHHDLLVANMSAQIPHLVCPRNRPTTLIILDRLTPENLGKLIALYEHRVFTGARSGGSAPSTSGGGTRASVR